jgi:hypothetical protein
MNKRAFVVMPTGLLVAVIFLFPLGCNPSTARDGMAVVTGKVTYQGKPVTGGFIHFVQAEQKIVLWIRGDGTYSGEVPLGMNKVAIETESVKYKDRDKMLEKWQETVGSELVERKQAKGELPGITAAKLVYVEIPSKYSDPEQSGLTLEVLAGKDDCDFPLD